MNLQSHRLLPRLAFFGLFLAASLSGQLARPQKAALSVAPDGPAVPGTTLHLSATVTIDEHWHVNSHTPTFEEFIPTELSLELPAGWPEPVFTYPAHKLMQFGNLDEAIAVYDGTVEIQVEIEIPDNAELGSLELPFSLQYQACDDKQCLAPTERKASTTVQITDGTDGANGGSAQRPGSDQGLFAMLLAGLLGGLILNAMPCVLPVLSLKIFGLVKSASEGRKHLVTGALATAAGIVVSFLALAAVAVIAQQAGAAVGWGVQFQQPGFVIFLTVVVLLFSLNMWGVFEIALPQSLARVGGGQAQEGLAGHFGAGLFATLMATPCSAPFLGTAVGFALAQKGATIFVIFLAVGLGMASPYLLLALFPGAARFLPKPGQWMVTLRGVMGFLLAASAIWLFYILAAQVSAEHLAFLQLSLLALCLFVWLSSKAAPATGVRRLWATLAIAAALGGIFLAANAPAAASGHRTTKLIDWVPFDETQAETLSSQGALVFVDVTADWCVTCKVIEKGVLETQKIADAFRSDNVIAMQADWSQPDPEILAYLNKYGRSSIPFYILYRPGKEPYIFNESLTKKRLLTALAESRTIAATEAGAATEP